MKVKSEKEITAWLLDNGYTHQEGYLRNPNRALPLFAYNMFEYCGKPKPTFYTWLPDWLEHGPVDCVGKICSVWDGEREPGIEDRKYYRVLKYEPMLEYSYIYHTNSYSWQHARVIDKSELEL